MFECPQVTYVIGASIGLLACLWIRVGDAADPYFKTYQVYAVTVALGKFSVFVFQFRTYYCLIQLSDSAALLHLIM